MGLRWPTAVRRGVGVLVAAGVLLALSGCRGSTGAGPAEADSPGAHGVVRGASYDAAGLTTVLAAAGVATVADEQSTAPVVPVRGARVATLTAWQVRNMAAETRSGAGVLGVDLDQALPLPDGAPPLAFVLGGWISSRGDSDAVAAGRLMGPVEWTRAESLVFPTAVLQLFVADALAHAGRPASAGPTSSAASGAASGAASAAPAAYVADLPLGGCSGIASFVDNALGQIFAALKVNPTDVANWVSGTIGGTVGTVVGTIAGFLASFWNAAVDLAEKALRNVLATLTAPVLDAMRTVIAALETVTTIVSYLKRWTVPLTADPTSNSFSVVGASAHRGSVTATVDRQAERDNWPDVFTDCAQALGKPVPTVSAKGEPVTWAVAQQESGLVSVDQPAGGKGALDDNLSAQFDYTAGQEDKKTAASPDVVLPTVTVTATIRRTEVDDLGDLLLSTLSHQFPPLIQPAIKAVLGPMFEWAKSQIDKLTSVDGSATMVISHHVPQPDPTPTQGATPSPSTSGPAPSWKPADPCRLLTSSDVSAAARHAVPAPRVGDNGITDVCGWYATWDAGGKHYELRCDISVYDERSTVADLERGRDGGGWAPLPGVGVRAFANQETSTVAFWQSGQLVSVHFLQSNYTWSAADSLAAAVALAKVTASRV